MSPPRILIVDDEASVRFVLEHTLNHEGYIIDTAATGPEALQKLAQNSYDLLLLDLYMEPMGGLELFNQAREQDSNLVVIILTAYSSVESAVEALRLGAFDYLFKPAPPPTIRQRVREGLQRRQQALQRQHLITQIEHLRQTLNDLETSTQSLPPAADQRFVRSGDLVIDRYHRSTTLNGQLIDLTTTEFELLLCLVKAAPKPLLPTQLVHCTLGYESDQQEAGDIIKWHIHHLRQKIEPDPKHPRYIKTVRHQGYLWSNHE